MIGFPEYALSVLTIALPVASLFCWRSALIRTRAGQPLLPRTYSTSVPWGLLDLGIVVVLLALVTGLGVRLAKYGAGIDPSAEITTLPPRAQAIVFASFGIASLVTTALSLAWLRLRFEPSSAPILTRSDMQLGLQWFAMLVVPVVLLQFTLTQWFPTKHPLIEMLRKSEDLRLLPIAAFSAVVAAPLFEEVFFRQLFQGWLEKLHTTLQRNKLGLTDRAERDAVIVGGLADARWPGDVSDMAGAVTAQTAADTESDQPVLWIPILISSLLFSLAHFSHGPDWIPLFFLALGLGYLYQRTHRIQPCIVVHFCVNLLGVLQLWAAIRQPD